MDTPNRFVVEGRDLNRQVRCLATLAIIMGAAFSLGILILNLNWFLTYDPPKIAVGLLTPATFLLFSAIGVHGLFRHPRIIVLRDGLEIGGRFVPYGDVTEVWLGSPPLAAMSYLFHGVEMTARFGRGGFANAGTLRVMTELRNRIGLRVGEATRAAAVQ